VGKWKDESVEKQTPADSKKIARTCTYNIARNERDKKIDG
jgi:hypothetical protein